MDNAMGKTAVRLERAIKALGAVRSGAGWWTYAAPEGEGEARTAELVELGKALAEAEDEQAALAAWLSA